MYASADPLVPITESAFHQAVKWQMRVGQGFLGVQPPLPRPTLPLVSEHWLWCFTLNTAFQLVNIDSRAARAAFHHITLAPKKLIRTRRASEGSASEPSLARRVSMCKDAKLSFRGNSSYELFNPSEAYRTTADLADVIRLHPPPQNPGAFVDGILAPSAHSFRRRVPTPTAHLLRPPEPTFNPSHASDPVEADPRVRGQQRQKRESQQQRHRLETFLVLFGSEYRCGSPVSSASQSAGVYSDYLVRVPLDVHLVADEPHIDQRLAEKVL